LIVTYRRWALVWALRFLLGAACFGLGSKVSHAERVHGLWTATVWNTAYPSGVGRYVCAVYDAASSSCIHQYAEVIHKVNPGCGGFAPLPASLSSDLLGDIGETVTITVISEYCGGTFGMTTISAPPHDNDIRALSLNEILVWVGGVLALGLGYLMAK
jgi:hypothetical protein